MLTLFLSSQRYNPVEQWIPEVVSIEAPSIVLELVTLYMAEIPKIRGEEINVFGGKWSVITTSFTFFLIVFLDFIS
uniref:Putative ovule protein n=1 Tax=Solanum chacoense TaxID=4108 RepID=A0A0V0GI72_SOLCH